MKFSSLFFYLLTKNQRMENGKQVVDGNLEGIKKSLEGSLKRLKTDYIDLYYLHRVDPNVPIEDIAYLNKGKSNIGDYQKQELKPSPCNMSFNSRRE